MYYTCYNTCHKLDMLLHVRAKMSLRNLLQPEENCPGPSLASRYTNWYIDKLLEHLTAGDVCFAPLRLCFVTKHQTAPNFNAELYTNIGELQVTS